MIVIKLSNSPPHLNYNIKTLVPYYTTFLPISIVLLVLVELNIGGPGDDVVDSAEPSDDMSDGLNMELDDVDDDMDEEDEDASLVEVRYILCLPANKMLLFFFNFIIIYTYLCMHLICFGVRYNPYILSEIILLGTSVIQQNSTMFRFNVTLVG